MEPDEESEWKYGEDEECPTCGWKHSNDFDAKPHPANCPANESPFARLMRDGYD